ncbi:MAG: tetratricopeptide repeat protein [Planctomycetota bacterium]
MVFPEGERTTVRHAASQPAADAYARGVSLYKRGEYARALQALRAVSGGELLGQLARYYAGLSHRALGAEATDAGRLDAAETHLRAAAAALGRSADLAEHLAAVYARRGRPNHCARSAAQAVELNADDVSAWRRLAQAQWQAARREEARMTLSSARRRLGERAPLLLQEGLFDAAEERWTAARRALSAAARLAPQRAEVHYYLGLVAAGAGDPVEAGGHLQRALDLRPGDMVVAHQLSLAAAAASGQGRRVRVRLSQPSRRPANSEVTELARYVTDEPEFLDACLSLPVGEADEELFGMLDGVLQVAMNEHRGYADLHHRRSRVLARLGRNEEAIEHARAAVRINPQYVAGLVHLGELYEQAGRLYDAVDALERAVACGGDWADVRCRAGELRARCGDRRGAGAHFRHALELNAHYRRAAEGLRAVAA